MQNRYAVVWLRYLLTDWFSIRQPELKDIPFALTAMQGNKMVLAATNIMAEQQGIYCGATVADAKAVLPQLKTINLPLGKAEKLMLAIGKWCIRYSPKIAIAANQSIIIDLSGCAHLWGGEYNYLKEIVKRLHSKGYWARGAIADTPGTAWAVAHYGKKQPIIPSRQQADALATLPPSALQLPPDILSKLHKIGFYTIESFMHLQRNALKRRFGNELLLKLDQALGTSTQTIQWIKPEVVFREHLPYPDTITTAKGIAIAIKQLLTTLCQSLRTANLGMLEALLLCYRVDGAIIKVNISVSQPSIDPSHLFQFFELKIPTIEPALGIELFTLEITKTEKIDNIQEAIWISEKSTMQSAQLAALLDRITTKLGNKSVYKQFPLQSYWPDRCTNRSYSLSALPQHNWRADRPRPILLLAKPEQIQVSSVLPDNPPMLFIYKGKKHTVVKADDAERIEPEWWLQEQQHRDYYIVEDTEGQRFWVFRAGHYTDPASKWYIHGFFA